jgi:CheY-like chemotaxis protein
MLGSIFKLRKLPSDDDASSLLETAPRHVEAYDLPTVPMERDDAEMNGFSHTLPEGTLLDVHSVMVTQPADLQGLPVMMAESGRKRVLVVDDDLMARLYLRARLELRGGVDVYEATSGEEALMLAQHSPFDCVLLDVDMGDGKSGYEVCREVRRMSAFHDGTKTRVFMITSRTGLVDRMRATLAGADAFLSKPPHPGQLADLLESL